LQALAASRLSFARSRTEKLLWHLLSQKGSLQVRNSVMNNTVYYDSAASDDARRQHLYDGQLFVYSPRQSILNFVDFARGKLKPAFIHHPELKRHLTATTCRRRADHMPKSE
jgi:hypothetical protein